MARKGGSEEISVKMLARIFEISERRVQQLAELGVFEKVRHGRYKLDGAGRAYADYLVKSEIERRFDDSSAKEQVEIERARKLKLENDTRENILIETPIAIAAIDLIVGQLRTDLAGVPARASEDVAIRRRVEDAINDVLEALADRFAKAGAALRAGRDPLEADETAAA